MMLAIDTSTLTASVAVIANSEVRAERDGQSQTHSSDLITLIRDALATAQAVPQDLRVVAVGLGPGSFTGLRIGLATAKGLAFALRIPLVGVSSLAALAMGAVRMQPDLTDRLILPLLDARREEVYAGLYRVDSGRIDGSRIIAVAPERTVAPERVLEVSTDTAPPSPVPPMPILCGDALAKYASRLPRHGCVWADGVRATPSAVDVGRIAATTDLALDITDTAAPIYIRPAEAEVKYPDGVPGALRKRS